MEQPRRPVSNMEINLRVAGFTLIGACGAGIVLAFIVAVVLFFVTAFSTHAAGPENPGQPYIKVRQVHPETVGSSVPTTVVVEWDVRPYQLHQYATCQTSSDNGFLNVRCNSSSLMGHGGKNLQKDWSYSADADLSTRWAYAVGVLSNGQVLISNPMLLNAPSYWIFSWNQQQTSGSFTYGSTEAYSQTKREVFTPSLASPYTIQMFWDDGLRSEPVRQQGATGQSCETLVRLSMQRASFGFEQGHCGEPAMASTKLAEWNLVPSDSTKSIQIWIYRKSEFPTDFFQVRFNAWKDGAGNLILEVTTNRSPDFQTVIGERSSLHFRQGAIEVELQTDVGPIWLTFWNDGKQWQYTNKPATEVLQNPEVTHNVRINQRGRVEYTGKSSSSP